MTQLGLQFLTHYDGPGLVDSKAVSSCQTYRQAVRTCWIMRKRTHMTRRQLAEETGCYPSHITDYLSDDDKRRELPAKHIDGFEIACGNRLITQWLTDRAHLTILETLVQQRAA